MVTVARYRRAELREAAYLLYAGAVEQARKPEFYLHLGVPDTLDGRYDMIVLHSFLLLRRLGREKSGAAPAATQLGQLLFDVMFADMDQNLREMGAGDLGVGRRVKAMAQGFYGRTAAYEKALAGPDSDLWAALQRNLYGTLTGPETPSQGAVRAMAAYIRREAGAVDDIAFQTLATGLASFGQPPAGLENSA